MSALFQALTATPTVYTQNGMPTLATSSNELLDLFGIIGNRNFNFENNNHKIEVAKTTDPVLTGRLFLWARDCRGGAGHRDPIRKLILKYAGSDLKFALALAAKLPEVGYYKDLIYLYENTFSKDEFVAFKTGIVDLIIIELTNALKEKRFSLLAKYMPRKGQTAVMLRNELKLSPKQYRKLVVQLSKTVEQQMCMKEWDKIKFENVPSVAMMRYRRAFERHTSNYEEFQNKVAKGETKLNAAQLTPGEIVYQVEQTSRSESTQLTYLQNAWNSLPDYLDNSTERWLPVIDVSGSMTTQAGNTNMTCMQIAMCLGVYLSERNKGIFQEQFITFSSNPAFVDMKGKKFQDIKNKFDWIARQNWDMSTNLERVFDLVLNAAVKNSIKESEMPTKIVIFSDMEFNSATRNSNDRALTMIKRRYTEAGYEMPQLVFWNLAGRGNNMTVNINDKGTCQVSGYSPAVLKNLTNLEAFTPMSVMLQTLGSDRYSF